MLSHITVKLLVESLKFVHNIEPKYLSNRRGHFQGVWLKDHRPTGQTTGQWGNQGNVDVQYTGHLGSWLPYYITDYISKHEHLEHHTMWQDIFTTTKSLGSNAMSFLLKSIKSCQVSANEAGDRLLGHKLHSKSRQLRFAYLAPQD